MSLGQGAAGPVGGAPDAEMPGVEMSGVEVLTLGEAMMSLRSAGPVRLGGSLAASVAGAESNVAIGLARLGHRVRWAGRLGTDQAGELVLRTLRAEGVAVDAVVRDAGAPTGLIVFEQRLPDVTRVDNHRAGSAGSRLAADDLGAALGAGARLLHVTGVTLGLSASAREAVEHAVRHARQAGWAVSLDVNYRSRLWSAEDAAAALRPLAELADVVIASDDELPLVADGVDDLLARGPREVVVKRGAEGASAHAAGRIVDVPAHAVPVVDSIGAGDAFSAGYLSAWLDGDDLEARVRRGAALGAFAVTHAGDWEALPTRDELPLIGARAGTALR